MPKIDTSKIQVSFKINRELNKVLEKKARLEQVTKTDLCQKALENELYKDTNIQNELLGSTQAIIKNQKRLEKKFDVYSTMFIYFLKYFFTAHKIEFENSKSSSFEIGEERKNKFIDNFKLENRQMSNIIEALLADYVAQEL